MKKIFYVFTVVVAVILSSTSCVNSLQTQPTGADVSIDQINSNIDGMSALLSGLYGGLSYDSDTRYTADEMPVIEGQKYIDVRSDMLVSDAAADKRGYGWLVVMSYMQEYRNNDTYNSWLWRYSYRNISNANRIIRGCKQMLANSNTSEKQKANLNLILGQAYVLRAHYYSNLLNFYVKASEVGTDTGAIPYYNEDNMDEVQGLSSYRTVVAHLIEDMNTGLGLISTLESQNKITLDANIAKIILAYIQLNRGLYFDLSAKQEAAQAALTLAEEVINSNKYQILPYDQVLTQGFNTISSCQNWMWGVDITTETTISFYTFWSFVDIYTMGYASVGTYICLDKGIYDNMDNMLSATDVRKKWWNNVSFTPGGTVFGLVANNKFFDSRRTFQGDEQHVNDYVLMRIEEAYLIAAEAAFALGDETKAKSYLKTLIAQRDPSYNVDALTGDALKNYIANNWRIEMWLEGKTFMAFKRFGWTHTRGSNHFMFPGESLNASDERFTFQIPLSETNYNPNI